MNIVDGLGLAATACSVSAFVPQVWRTWRTRDVSGISLATYIIVTTGIFLWFWYAFFKQDAIMLFANVVSGLLTGAMVVMKIAFQPRVST